MPILAIVLSLLVAAEHVGFMVLEMAFWDKPFGLKTFHQTLAQAQASRVLAANQGLYNGFLAAGVLFALLRADSAALTFVLGCVIVAGLFGAATVSRRIALVQGLPAAVALAALRLGI